MEDDTIIVEIECDGKPVKIEVIVDLNQLNGTPELYLRDKDEWLNLHVAPEEYPKGELPPNSFWMNLRKTRHWFIPLMRARPDVLIMRPAYSDMHGTKFAVEILYPQFVCIIKEKQEEYRLLSGEEKEQRKVVRWDAISDIAITPCKVKRTIDEPSSEEGKPPSKRKLREEDTKKRQHNKRVGEHQGSLEFDAGKKPKIVEKFVVSTTKVSKIQQSKPKTIQIVNTSKKPGPLDRFAVPNSTTTLVQKTD